MVTKMLKLVVTVPNMTSGDGRKLIMYKYFGMLNGDIIMIFDFRTKCNGVNYSIHYDNDDTAIAIMPLINSPNKILQNTLCIH